MPGVAAKKTDFGVMSKDEWGDYALVRGIGPADVSAAPREQAHSAFARLDDALAGFGMDFADVARVWLYADGILDWYADVNRARDDFFREHGVFDRFVPAATG
ncbi:MAG: RidA family protein, partial [Kiritimatiellae bacterium]|nr:RidA family protein [Kiritimatiellia bacterium]